MSKNLYLRCEIWEDEACEFDEVFYIYDGEYGRHYIDDKIKSTIKNPLNLIDTKKLWKEINKISEKDEKNGVILKTIILDDDIHEIDIITKEPDIFPYQYEEFYDENKIIRKVLKTNYIKEINSLVYNLFK